MAQGRRARLVIRRIEPLTVLKVAVLFWASVYVILLVAAVMLWTAATVTDLRGNVESFVGELIAADDFKFKAGQLLQASALGGALLVGLGSFTTVMMAVLYNLIADVVGGVAVILEETAGKGAVRRAAPKGGATASVGKIAAKVSSGARAATTAAASAKDTPPRPPNQPERASRGQH